MEKIQVYTNLCVYECNTMLMDVIRYVIVRHVQISDPRCPTLYIGSTHHPRWNIKTHSREILEVCYSSNGLLSKDSYLRITSRYTLTSHARVNRSNYPRTFDTEIHLVVHCFD